MSTFIDVLKWDFHGWLKFYHWKNSLFKAPRAMAVFASQYQEPMAYFFFSHFDWKMPKEYSDSPELAQATHLLII